MTVYAETGKITSAVYKKNASLSSTITDGNLTMMLSTPAYTTEGGSRLYLNLKQYRYRKKDLYWNGFLPAGRKPLENGIPRSIRALKTEK